jgi:hypothetical protein
MIGFVSPRYEKNSLDRDGWHPVLSPAFTKRVAISRYDKGGVLNTGYQNFILKEIIKLMPAMGK